MLLADIRSLLTQATAVPIIFAHQNAPRPARPYIAVSIVSQTMTPHVLGEIDDDGNQEIAAHRISTVELQCFADDPLSILDALLLRLHGDVARAGAAELDIAVMGPGTLQSMPVVRDGAFIEPRAIAEITIGSTSRTQEQTSFVETVYATSIVGDVSTDHVITVITP